MATGRLTLTRRFLSWGCCLVTRRAPGGGCWGNRERDGAQAPGSLLGSLSPVRELTSQLLRRLRTSRVLQASCPRSSESPGPGTPASSGERANAISLPSCGISFRHISLTNDYAIASTTQCIHILMMKSAWFCTTDNFNKIDAAFPLRFHQKQPGVS